MTRIVILGSGFAALTTIRRLRALGVREPVTVVSPRNELVYLPSLIWLPSGERSGEDLRIPLACFFERHAVHWHRGSVLEVADGGRRVVTDTGDVDSDVLDGLCRQFGQLGGLWWQRGEPVRLRMQAAKPSRFRHPLPVDWLE